MNPFDHSFKLIDPKKRWSYAHDAEAGIEKHFIMTIVQGLIDTGAGAADIEEALTYALTFIRDNG